MITLTRTSIGDDGVFGRLTDGDQFIAYTLEHSYPDGPKIPEGSYLCKMGPHNLHSGPITTYELQSVHDHYGILIHPGNKQDDSEGCILIGQDVTQANGSRMLMRSRLAWEQFIERMGGEDFTLEVRNALAL